MIHKTWFYQNSPSSFLPRILKIKFRGSNILEHGSNILEPPHLPDCLGPPERQCDWFPSECDNINLESRCGHSHLKTPVRLGGFGFRSLEDSAGIAYLGALEQAIPSYSGEDGICNQLDEVMGGQGCFGDDAPSDMRWKIMLESGSREGEELRRVWSKLRQEELQAAAWLEEEVQSSFQQEADDQVPGCKPCLVLTVAFPVQSSCLHLLVKTNWAMWSGEGRWLTCMARWSRQQLCRVIIGGSDMINSRWWYNGFVSGLVSTVKLKFSTCLLVPFLRKASAGWRGAGRSSPSSPTSASPLACPKIRIFQKITWPS